MIISKNPEVAVILTGVQTGTQLGKFDWLLQQSYSSYQCHVWMNHPKKNEHLTRVHLHAPTDDLTTAINQVWQDTTAEILVWLHQGDYWHSPDFLRHAVEYFVDHIEVAVLYGDFVPKGQTHHWNTKFALEYCHPCLARPAVLMKREAVMAVGGLDTRLPAAHLQDLWLRMGLMGYEFIYVAGLDASSGYPLVSDPLTRDFQSIAQAHITLIQNALASPQFPPEWKPIRRRALSNAYLKAMSDLWRERASIFRFMKLKEKAIAEDASNMQVAFIRFFRYLEYYGYHHPLAFLYRSYRQSRSRFYMMRQIVFQHWRMPRTNLQESPVHVEFVPRQSELAMLASSQGELIKPKKISVISSGRNDAYAKNFKQRMMAALDRNQREAANRNLNIEWIFIEWNPTSPDYLGYELAHKGVTSYIVSPGLHQRVVSPRVRNYMSFMQFFAKNVGIRRAEGDWLLITNADCMFDDNVWDFLAAGELSPHILYRAERCDIDLRLFDRPFADIRQQIGIYYDIAQGRQFTAGSGDFTLLPAEAGFGYDEAVNFSDAHLDGRFCMNWSALQTDGDPDNWHCFQYIGQVYKARHHLMFDKTAATLRYHPKGIRHWNYNRKTSNGVALYNNPPNWGFANEPQELLAEGVWYIGPK